MRNKLIDNIKALILTVLAVLSGEILTSLPWWSFLVVVVIVGAVLKGLNVTFNAFLIGLVSGFLIWFGFSAYHDSVAYQSTVVLIGAIMNYPKALILVSSGLIGGLLSGLALHTGKYLYNLVKTPVAENRA